MNPKYLLNALLSFALLLAMGMASANLHAGSLTNGQTITLSESDFSEGTANASWAIYSPSASENTELWNYYAITQGTSAMIASVDSKLPECYATWKIDVPGTMEVTNFTWATSRLVLAGNGDDSFSWQYSIDDGATWTTFYTIENDFESPLTLNNQSWEVTIVGSEYSSSLLIRGGLVEGSGTSGDSGYFQIWSNPTAGGTNPNSYISVTAIPEASSFGILVGASCLLTLLAKRYRSRH